MMEMNAWVKIAPIKVFSSSKAGKNLMIIELQELEERIQV